MNCVKKQTKKFTLFLWMLLLPSLVICQKFLKKKFRDHLDPNAKLKETGYNYTLEMTKTKEFIYKQYFPETSQITHLITYKSRSLKTMHGKYREWYDDGKMWKSGSYREGQKTGLWKISDYIRTESGTYEADQRVGEWVTKDSLGQLLEKYFYKNGQLDGNYVYYDENGALRREDLYKNGELLYSSMEDSSAVEGHEEMPKFPGCTQALAEETQKCADQKMLAFIYSNINYPSIARRNDIQGSALVRFVINKEGKVEHINVVRGLCASIKKECQSIIERMPLWQPGMQNGKPVNVTFTMPIRFRLE